MTRLLAGSKEHTSMILIEFTFEFQINALKSKSFLIEGFLKPGNELFEFQNVHRRSYL